MTITLQLHMIVCNLSCIRGLEPHGSFNLFSSTHTQPLSLFAVQFLNAVGDLLDLIPALLHEPKLSLVDYRPPPMGHCSALIKVSFSLSK